MGLLNILLHGQVLLALGSYKNMNKEYLQLRRRGGPFFCLAYCPQTSFMEVAPDTLRPYAHCPWKLTILKSFVPGCSDFGSNNPCLLSILQDLRVFYIDRSACHSCRIFSVALCLLLSSQSLGEQFTCFACL